MPRGAYKKHDPLEELPPMWWWDLLRAGSQLAAADPDTGRQPIGMVVLFMCEELAPTIEWRTFAGKAVRRLTRDVLERSMVDEAESIGVDPQVYAAFADHSHLGLKYPLSNKRSGRRRRAAPHITSWWQRFWQ